jgi:8-oxo-dGTP pyrophosphatase MutT (NUDIX family)
MTDTIHVPHQLTRHTKLLHKVAMVIDHKVLVLQRSESAESRPGCWDLPGGNSEWPTTTITEPTANLHQADVAREIVEETGLQVSADNFTLSTLNYFESFYQPSSQIYTIICGWQVTDPAGVGLATSVDDVTVTISAEHQRYVWVSESELKQYDFGGEKGEFVVQIASKALQSSYQE